MISDKQGNGFLYGDVANNFSMAIQPVNTVGPARFDKQTVRSLWVTEAFALRPGTSDEQWCPLTCFISYTGQL